MDYTFSLFKYKRRTTNQVDIGNVTIGSDFPIVKQSMATTDTNLVSESVDQCIRMVNAGAELVRFTTQGTKEAEQLGIIRKELEKKGVNTPLVADVHFNSNAALEAAKRIEKVRINPGNFADKSKRFSQIDLSPDEYELELEKIEERFVPFLEICKEHNTAIRIGVNHGSLSDRIMSRYGDTSEGMVESCMEYLRIAQKHDFNKIVISIKASNTRIMVQTVRLLVAKMNAERLSFPLHLGVTEAGDGEDGRIKSAVGIGALLADGIGDTIRVSLSEDPENELPVCSLLLKHFKSYEQHQEIEDLGAEHYSPYVYNRRKTVGVFGIGSTNKIAVGISSDKTLSAIQPKPDYVFHSEAGYVERTTDSAHIELVDASVYQNAPGREQFFLKGTVKELRAIPVQWLKLQQQFGILVQSDNVNKTADYRAFALYLQSIELEVPLMVFEELEILTNDKKITLAASLGLLFLDGLLDGIVLHSSTESADCLSEYAFSLLQASRARFTKTEFISCPGCGRTLFNLQSTIAKVKEATQHLTGLKIGIMGCVVNGPGEMADADYGYVGAGKGKVSLYKGKECVLKNIDEEEAVSSLIDIIKANNDWVEPINS